MANGKNYDNKMKRIVRGFPLHICLIAPVPPPKGGIAQWVVLVRRYAKMRNDIDIDTINTSPSWRAIDDMAIWKRVIGGGVQLVRDYFRFVLMLWKRPDVIHLTTSGQLATLRDIAILATSRFIGVPTVYHIHFGRIPEIVLNNTNEWKLLSLAIRMASAVIAIDPVTSDTIARIFPNVLLKRIPNGIDLNLLPLALPVYHIKTLIYLGWTIPTKGMAELCQAWSELSLPEWRCLIVGPGSELYRQELRDLYHSDNLEFITEQSHEDAMLLLAGSDVFVLPSYTEGFPNVIIEAMALGKSIVSTNVGAIPEMLSDGCGVTVPPHDVNALSMALYNVCSDEELRLTMGRRAYYKSHTEYSMDKVIEQLKSFWIEVSEKS
jgi:glycosyltransferase involved in cell wall biosynthesis